MYGVKYEGENPPGDDQADDSIGGLRHQEVVALGGLVGEEIGEDIAAVEGGQWDEIKEQEDKVE